jgi:hypothetical protein
MQALPQAEFNPSAQALAWAVLKHQLEPSLKCPSMHCPQSDCDLPLPAGRRNDDAPFTKAGILKSLTYWCLVSPHIWRSKY